MSSRSKRGLVLSNTLDLSDVNTYRSDFRKVINTKDVYMSSPRNITTWFNAFKD